MGEPPHRLARVIRLLLVVAVLLVPVSPIAVHLATGDAEAHQSEVAAASRPLRAPRARRRTRQPQRRAGTRPARSVVPFPSIRPCTEPPLPPLRV
ncbi:MAG TPA: hypothetical protein VFU93_15890 [Acidimicrobiales bacterium]|nr:hypothetical protein [Acidimicrobiales bacterium]